MKRKLREDEYGLYVIYSDAIYRPNKRDEDRFFVKGMSVDLHVFNTPNEDSKGKILRSDEISLDHFKKSVIKHEVFFTFDLPLSIHENINILKENEKFIPFYNYREVVMSKREAYLLWNYSDLMDQYFFTYDTRRFSINKFYDVNMNHLLMDIYRVIGESNRGGSVGLKRKLKLQNLNLI